MVSPGPVCMTALCTRFITASVSRCRSASTTTSAAASRRHRRSPMTVAFATISWVSRSSAVGSSRRKSRCSALARISRSPTSRLIRVTSSSTRAMVHSASGAVGSSSSRCPRQIARGSRISCPAVRTNSRWLSSTDSRRSSMALKLCAMSAASPTVATGTRWDMSDSEIERAVSVSWRTGSRTRPATGQAMAVATPRTASETSRPHVRISEISASSPAGRTVTTNRPSCPPTVNA